MNIPALLIDSTEYVHIVMERRDPLEIYHIIMNISNVSVLHLLTQPSYEYILNFHSFYSVSHECTDTVFIT